MSLRPYSQYRAIDHVEIASVPEHWKVVPLNTVARVVNGYPFDSEEFDPFVGVPLIRIRDLDQSEAESCFKGEVVEAALVSSDDVLVGMDGDFNVGRWRGEGLALLNQRMCCVRTETPELTRFLEYVLPSRLKAINDVTFATTVKHLSSRQVERLVVALPTEEQETRRIVAFLDVETRRIDNLVEEQRRLIALLAEKRQAVISHAVTKGLNPDAPTKATGLDWLGAVPDHWRASRLRVLFRQTKRQDQSDLPVLSVYRDFGVIRKDSRDDNYNKTPEDLSKYQLVNPGDLVVNKMKAWQGSLGISPHEGITSPDYLVFVPTHGESASYLHWLLRSSVLVSVYRGISNGIRLAQWRLEPDPFLDLRVFIPSLEEQVEIAAFVDRQEQQSGALIDEAERAIALLIERRSALITAAVTGQIDVRALAPTEAP